MQHECIPQAILGMDVICQAKSGMGKTAVFVISVLQQLETANNEIGALILCHTRELAYQVRLFLPDESRPPERPRRCLHHNVAARVWRPSDAQSTSPRRFRTSSSVSAPTCRT